MVKSSLIRRLLFAFIGLSLSTVCASAKNIPIDGYSALVDDRIITIGDVIMQMHNDYPNLNIDLSDEASRAKLSDKFDKSRNALIEKALILQEFKSSGASVPDPAIDNHIATIIHDRFDNNRLAFLEALSKEHITIHEWREQIRDQIVLMILHRQEVMDLTAVTPSDIWAYYNQMSDKYKQPEQLKIRAIVIKVKNKAQTADKKLIADGVINQLKDGADFASLAMNYSEDNKAQDGGDWGWMNASDLRSEFAAALKGLTPGQYTDVLEIGRSFYILQLEDRKEQNLLSFADVHKKIVDELRTKEEGRLYRAWIDRLKDKHYVHLF